MSTFSKRLKNVANYWLYPEQDFISDHKKVKEKIEKSTSELRDRTEELLAEMVRKNECRKDRKNDR